MLYILTLLALAMLIGAALVPPAQRREEQRIKEEVAREDRALEILTYLETLEPDAALLKFGSHHRQGHFPPYVNSTMSVGSAIGAIEIVTDVRSSAAVAAGTTSKRHP